VCFTNTITPTKKNQNKSEKNKRKAFVNKNKLFFFSIQKLILLSLKNRWFYSEKIL